MLVTVSDLLLVVELFMPGLTDLRWDDDAASDVLILESLPLTEGEFSEAAAIFEGSSPLPTVVDR